MEKVIVHTIKITMPREKHIFQITLPENTEAVTGLSANADKARVIIGGKSDPAERACGTIQLFVADTCEHLYSDTIKMINTPCRMQPFDQTFPLRTVPSYKTKFDLMDTWQPFTTTIIDGYYKDLVGNLTENVSYTLRIYLRIKLR